MTITPAWRRATEGEHRWPAALAISVAVALQVTLPDSMTPGPWWVLPALEVVLLIVLLIANPRRMSSESTRLRFLSIGLGGLVCLATAWSVVNLIVELVGGRFGDDAVALLRTGGAIWLTNIIAFTLVFWEFDRGGPADRAAGVAEYPDFLFVQMQSPDMARPDWEPAFLDYLYLSFTNSTAFSPTDTMPLSRWAKATMLFESTVSLVTVALVIARAVNVLR
ncbi:hypothetical protein [Pseudonocardia sp. GCM10023141]|uniref:hypothetical protein n=1 Tax=Pseudonocardia sp. GCM10023141 TaxID=3252653 RepID=UPI0036071036